jgi:predicted phosphoribosyltransferase
VERGADARHQREPRVRRGVPGVPRGRLTATQFANRSDAGRRLAAALPRLSEPLVLGLPRGGVPVAAAVAEELGAPLDVFVVRKLGLPAQPELAMGAIATGGVRVLNDDVLRTAGVRPAALEEVTRRESEVLAERERRYREGRDPPVLARRQVLLVDDGLATGATMRAAVSAARLQEPERVVVAIPVAPRETVRSFRRDGIDIVCALAPAPFVAVGAWYADFTPTSDAEVVRLLRRSRS